MSVITDTKSARALVKYERDRSKVVYADYIAANGVTLETVSEHVKELQDLAFPAFDAKTASDAEKYDRKTFGNRVRNGLNHTLGKHLLPREAPAEAAEADDDEPESAESAPTAPETARMADHLRVAAQVAAEAVINMPDAYDADTVAAVREVAMVSGVAATYIDALPVA